MELKTIILKKIEEKGEAAVADLIKITHFSRAYLNRFLQQLREDGLIILIGRGRGAKYVKAEKKILRSAQGRILSIRKTVKNKDISEDAVLDQIKRDTGIFLGLPKNAGDILNYAFSEMMNNAIEHSGSKTIEIRFKRERGMVRFEVIDFGVGIYNNIMKKRGLKNELEAIQDLLKGKQTTAPAAHTGEGIFFTAKAADSLTIASSTKKLIYNNLVDDIFIHDIKSRTGTKVIFSLAVKASKKLRDIFNEYSDSSYEFAATKVLVRLYKMGDLYVARSQARRLMVGLEKFKRIILDFSRLNTVGQSFADEIFRVWQSQHPQITLEVAGSNDNIDLMIKRAKNSRI